MIANFTEESSRYPTKSTPGPRLTLSPVHSPAVLRASDAGGGLGGSGAGQSAIIRA